MKIILKTFLIFLFLNANSFAEIVKWSSKEGIARLESSQFKTDFYQLADHFQPQINPLYCSAAASVIILNALNSKKPSQKDLEVLRPEVFGGGNIEFKSYSQLTFFNEKTDKIKRRAVIEMRNLEESHFDPGLTLEQLKRILREVYQLRVQMQYFSKAEESQINDFRDLVKNITKDKKKFLLINFHGKNLGLKTGGHISPLVAFDESSDSVLMLDVAGHKNGWYWVDLKDLVGAMNTKDGENFRGFLVVRK